MDSSALTDSRPTYTDQLVLRDGGRMLCVVVDEIDWVGAAGNYIEIHAGRKTHLVRHTIKAMVPKLDPERFVRVRPSAIVKVAAVAALEARVGGDYILRLRDGTEIRSSRSFRSTLERIFGKPPRGGRRLLESARGRRPGRPVPPLLAGSVSASE